jgi:hypothetical protein
MRLSPLVSWGVLLPGTSSDQEERPRPSSVTLLGLGRFYIRVSRWVD